MAESCAHYEHVHISATRAVQLGRDDLRRRRTGSTTECMTCREPIARITASRLPCKPERTDIMRMCMQGLAARSGQPRLPLGASSADEIADGLFDSRHPS